MRTKLELTIKDTICIRRGGSQDDVAVNCRSTFRGWDVPDYRIYDLGFRAARKAQS